MRAQAFVPGSEVVIAGRARQITVRADHHRRRATQKADDLWVIELIEVNDRRLACERLAEPHLQRGLLVEQLRAAIQGDPVRCLVRLDLRRQNRHTRPTRGERSGACRDMSNDPAISHPSRHHHEH